MRIASLLLAAASTLGVCQGGEDTTFRGTLPQALLLVGQTFHVPVLAEMVDPLPSDLSITLSPSSKASAVLAALVVQCPGYIVVREKDGFIVVQKDLFGDPANPMNEVVRDFAVPNNLGDFRLYFSASVGNAEQGIQGIGGVLSGPVLHEGVSVPLKVETLHNQTAREILLHVAGEVGNLFSAFVVPSAHPHEQMVNHTSLQAWELAGGPGIMTYRSQIKVHPESRCRRDDCVE